MTINPGPGHVPVTPSHVLVTYIHGHNNISIYKSCGPGYGNTLLTICTGPGNTPNTPGPVNTTLQDYTPITMTQDKFYTSLQNV